MRHHIALSCLAALVCVVPTPNASAQTGLPPGKWTVIIHGRVSGSSAFGPCGYPGTYDDLTADSPGSDGWDNWVRQIADHIEWLSNGSPPVNIYKMSAATLDLQVVNTGGTNPQDQSRHHILMFDWARTSGIVDAQFLQELFYCDAYTGSDDGFAYAAGEALSATLRHIGADRNIFAMIGYSRGAVVASEVTKRLISANHNPAQVIYLDGEGCDGATCFIYTDGEFNAWLHSSSSPIRFDNIYSSFNERYPQPTHCPSGTDMGGHARQACRGLAIDDQLYAHTPHLGGIIHCVASYSQSGVWDYLINHLNISNGLYTYNPDDPVQEPSVSPSIFSSAGLLFNGDFQWGSVAGWYGNGGGPSAESNGAVVLSNGAAYWLALAEGFSMTHSYFAMPACASEFSFEASRAIGDGLQNELVVTLSSPGVTPEVLPSISVASLTDTLQPLGPYAVPERFLGRACRIRFEHTQSGALDTIVHIDNVALDAIGPPPTPANPIIVDSSCGNATLGFSGSPPPGVTWFWQWQICATRVDLGSEPTLSVPTIGTYYLRARCDQTSAWSDSCGSVQVTEVGDALPGDVNSDGSVDLSDLAGLLAHFGTPSGASRSDGDLDGDGDVDLTDLSFLLAHFGESCPDAPPVGMVNIAASAFQMGDSFNEGGSNERPVHTVQLSPYAIDEHEVTSAQYAAALNWAKDQGNLITVPPISGVVYKANSGTSFPYCATTAGSSSSPIVWNGIAFGVVAGKELHPMVEVTWYGAAAFCNWRSAIEGRELCYNLSNWACDFTLRGYRLPTEAEWENAARGGVPGRRFSWSDVDTIQHSRANYNSSANWFYDTSPTRGYHPAFNTGVFPYTNPVDYFPANDYGLRDTTGNVSEWCNDWFANYSPNSQVNPIGPLSGTSRILRGGTWFSSAPNCRVAARHPNTPVFRSERDGFRCALSTNPGFALVDVPGTADPWLAGMPAGSRDGNDRAPGQSPREVTGLNFISGEHLRFAAGGSVSLGGSSTGPDGRTDIVSHNAGATNGIANVFAPASSLIGVFLGPDQPNLTPAPPALSFSDASSQNYSVLLPQTKQVFFIGNGLTSGGTVQEIVVPAGATRLFLGVLDTNDWANNSGAFQVHVTRIP